MDHLGFLTNFLAVVDEGSLSAGARRQGISQPAISQQIAALERAYGHVLLQRDKSGVTPTAAGQLVCRHALDLKDSYTRMMAELEDLDATDAGSLKISTSQAFAQLIMGDLIYDLRESHPDLRIQLRSEDRLVDVIREGYDLAIRTGSLGQSEGFAHKIGDMVNVLVASTNCIRKNGFPTTPKDLETHEFIEYSVGRTNGFISATHQGAAVQIPVRIGFTADTPNLMTSALLRGLGYARAPLALVQPMIDAGKLQRILPDYQLDLKPVYAVYPHRHAVNRRTRLLLDQAVARLQSLEAKLAETQAETQTSPQTVPQIAPQMS